MLRYPIRSGDTIAWAFMPCDPESGPSDNVSMMSGVVLITGERPEHSSRIPDMTLDDRDGRRWYWVDVGQGKRRLVWHRWVDSVQRLGHDDWLSVIDDG